MALVRRHKLDIGASRSWSTALRKDGFAPGTNVGRLGESREK